MAKNLLIVESPAKSKTIEKYLGSDYQVAASYGHVRDLPKNSLGVDLDHDFAPHYIIPKNAKKTVTNLKKSLSGKSTVYIATDLDREGEAIGWHVVQALGLNQLKDKRLKVKGPEIKRITFHEITKSALLDSLKHPRIINQDLVNAQQARRVLDRLVGYTLSPFLWRKIYKGLSAGRVQSVALRLIVDRERERQAFKPQDYWTIQAILNPEKSQNRLVAILVSYQGKKIDQFEIKTSKEGESLIKKLKQADYLVADFEKSETHRYPKPPYTTSTLQQDSINKLNFSAKKTMILAQKLYEAGLITYMRTDSVNLSTDALNLIRKLIDKKFGSQYLPEKAIFYQTKSKSAQEAHEAIRPTNPSLEIGQVVKNLDPNEARLYELIWKRSIACQMNPAKLEKQIINIKALDYGFRASGLKVLFAGFLRLLANEEERETTLPEVNTGDKLNLIDLISEKHTTEPPARFSEAKLVKTLEELGIGRPSTYAPTIDTLINRNYVLLENKQLIPQEIGFDVSDLLVEHFPEIVDTDFTAEMEDNLDLIALGKLEWPPFIKKFWDPFSKKVEAKQKSVKKINTDIPTDEVCQVCGKPMVEKLGRFGRFLACTGFPDCKNTKAIVNESTLICPRDNSKLVFKNTKKRKSFFGCAKYPECDFAIWKPTDMEKKIKELEDKGEKFNFKREAVDSSQSKDNPNDSKTDPNVPNT